MPFARCIDDAFSDEPPRHGPACPRAGPLQHGPTVTWINANSENSSLADPSCTGPHRHVARCPGPQLADGRKLQAEIGGSRSHGSLSSPEDHRRPRRRTSRLDMRTHSFVLLRRPPTFARQNRHCSFHCHFFPTVPQAPPRVRPIEDSGSPPHWLFLRPAAAHVRQGQLADI